MLAFALVFAAALVAIGGTSGMHDLQFSFDAGMAYASNNAYPRSTVEINDGTANGPVLSNRDNFGMSVAAIGDLDGDGVPDLAAGASGDDNGGPDRGAVHVMFMNRDGTIRDTVEINSGTANGPVLSTGDRFGVSVVAIGDLDGDGVQDLVVGAYGEDNPGENSGAVHVMFMNRDGTVKDTVVINEGTANGPVLSDSDDFGISVAVIDDLDGDGVPDLVVGANGDRGAGPNSGAVHVMFMNRDGTVKDTVKINSGTANGPVLSAADGFGISVAAIDDLDGDGVPDIAAGAWYDRNSGPDRGAVHVMFMNRDGTVKDTVEINSGTANGPVLSDSDHFGVSVAAIGDFDGDGVPDLAAGAWSDDNGGPDRGAVHVMFMNRDGTVKDTVEINSGTANGPVLSNRDHFGVSVAAIGDFDGDGVPDLAAGALNDDNGGPDRGAVHIIYINDMITNGNGTMPLDAVDTSSPAPVISSSAQGHTNAYSIDFTVDFGEPVDPATFTSSDVHASGGTVSDPLPVNGTTMFVFTISDLAAGNLTVHVPEGGILDPAGNGNTASDPYVIKVDWTHPSPSIYTAATSPVNASSIDFTVDFGEPVNPATFTSSDVHASGGTVSDPLPVNGTTMFVFTVSDLAAGNLTVHVPEGGILDPAGNGNTASDPYVIEVERPRPSPSIYIAARSVNTLSIDFTVDFGEPVDPETFTSSDVHASGGTVSDPLPVNGTTMFVFTVSDLAAGNLTVHVPEGGILDPAGNGNTASDPYVIKVDWTHPSPSIYTAATSPVNASSIDFTVDFGEPVDPATFTSSDVHASGGTVSDPLPVNGTTMFVFTVSDLAAGNLTVHVPEGGILDPAGNGNTASNSLTLAVIHFPAGTAPDAGFVTTWKTTTANEEIMIPTDGMGGSYTVTWGDASISTHVVGDQTHVYKEPGTYLVSIYGDFTRIYLPYHPENSLKLLSIEQWGDIRWESMRGAFNGATNMVYRATDTPNLSAVTDTSEMLRFALRFNGNLSNWDVSSVTDMSDMFSIAGAFNGDISTWNVSSVTDMSNMFLATNSFDQNLGNWYVVLHDTSISGANEKLAISAQNAYLDGQNPTYAVDDPLFVVTGGALSIKPGLSVPPGSYEVTVTSTGGFGQGNSKKVEISVGAAQANSPPSVDAGEPVAVREGVQVTLNATASDQDGDQLTYSWRHDSSLEMILTDADSLVPSFTAPQVHGNTTIAFTLTADDGMENGTDTVQVTVLDEPANSPPSVDAGEPVAVREGVQVTLNATASDQDGDQLTYSWRHDSSLEMILTDADSLAPSFTAPQVHGNTTIAFTLTADDGMENGTDTVQVTVLDEPANSPPSVDAGEPVAVREGVQVTLNATASDQDGDQLTYSWRHDSSLEMILTDADSLAPSFTAPQVHGNTTIAFTLTADDGMENGTDTVQVTVLDEPANSPPSVDAGEPVAVREGVQVTLNATASDQDGDQLTYSWRHDSSLEMILTDADSLVPSFTAPQVHGNTTIAFTLTADDGMENGTDTVQVTVLDEPANSPPSVDAGEPVAVREGVQVTLNATASDQDGDQLTYSWRHDSSLEMILTDADSLVPSFTAPQVHGNTTIAFTLTADDGMENGTDTVQVTVLDEPANSPPSVDAGEPVAVREGVQVTLNATASDQDGDQLTYSWRHDSSLEMILTDADSLAPSFTAPQVHGNTTIAFTLTADDGMENGTDTVQVTVLDEPANSPPSVDAGEPVAVREGVQVTLNATASDQDGDQLTYSWRHDSSLEMILTDADSLAPSFTAPQVHGNTTIAFTLTADDGMENGTDTVQVTILDVPAVGTPNGGSGQNTTVVLNPDEPLGPRDIGRIILTSTTPGTIDASWVAPSEAPANYRISWAKVGDPYLTWTDSTGNAFPTDLAHTITGLEAGETYNVKVRASYSGTAGDWSGDVTITIAEVVTNTIAEVVTNTIAVPGTPVNIGVSPGSSGTLDISWQAPAFDGGSSITGYTIQWKAASGDWTVPSDVSEAATTGTSHTITGLTEGTTYAVRVFATNSIGDGVPSAESMVTQQTPQQPLGSRDIGRIILTSTAPGTMEASWVAPSEAPANYRISWAKVGDPYLTWTDSTGNAFPTDLAHTITGLEGGETYNVKVRASYSGTAGDWSGDVTITIAEAATNTIAVPDTPVTTVVTDTTAPTISSIERYSPSSATTDSQTLTYKVTFSEDVTGVGTADFALSSDSTGETNGNNPVTSISGSGSVYYAEVSASTDGTYNLDLVQSGHGIADTASNPLANTTPTGADETYTFITAVTDSIAPTVSSIERYNPSSATTESRTLVYRITFSEDVTGVGTVDFALSSDSTGNTNGNNPVASISGSGSVYYAEVSASTDGTYNLDLVSSGHGIADTASNQLTNTAPTGADETYTVSTVVTDTTAPTISSIERSNPSSATTESRTLVYRITFSEDVTGVGTVDFALSSDSTGNTNGNNPVASISGSGSVYYAEVSASTDGTYNLDLVSSGHGIADTASNQLTNTAPTGADETYTVSTVVTDTTAPTISSIERSNPSSATTESRTLVYRITFSEDVTGVGTVDFALSSDSTGNTNGNNPVASISGSGSVYYAEVSASTDGTYNLDLVSSGHGIADTASNQLTNTAPTGADETYTVSTVVTDTTAPTISSIERSNPSSATTESRTLVYRITFSEDVTGVGTADFALSSDSTGNTNGNNPVASISGSGSVYYAEVSASTDGTYNLDLVSSGHGIADTASNQLTNTAPTGADETYTVSTVVTDTTAPTISSIERSNPSSATTESRTLVYRITFSEDVTGVGTADFALSSDSTGETNGNNPVTSISGSGDTYYATVSASTDGTYNLDLVSSGHGIADTASNQLTNTAPTGADETYTVSTVVTDTTAPTISSIERSNPSSATTESRTLVYRITFSEDVTGVGTADFALSSDSTGETNGNNPVTSISGSGDTYYATVSASTDGTYNLDLVSSGHGIADESSNPLANTTPTGADETYTVSTTVIDTTANPRLESIERYHPTSQNTNAQYPIYKATFSKSVTGVGASDFVLSPDSTGGGKNGSSPIAGISGSGDTYYVIISPAVDGTYNLDLVSSGHSIADAASNPLTNTTPTGADQTYTVSR